MCKKMSRKLLKTIEVEVDKKGFSVWIKEEVDGRVKRHWVLDGSCILSDGEVRLGNPDIWNCNAVFNKENNAIELLVNK